jgi:hypothetical protein
LPIGIKTRLPLITAETGKNLFNLSQDPMHFRVSSDLIYSIEIIVSHFSQREYNLVIRPQGKTEDFRIRIRQEEMQNKSNQ